MKAKTEEQLKLPKFFASVIVMNHLGQVLLGKRTEDGIITPPGGHAQDHETPERAALRELFEETGLIAREEDLQTLPTIDTVNGRICHCYLWVTSQAFPTPKLDPDKEVKEWKWYDEHDLPAGIDKDPRRFESVRNAFMKHYGIIKAKPQCKCSAKDTPGKQHCVCNLEKGGEGSGKVGHKTFHPDAQKEHVLKLIDKLSNPAPLKAHLNKLEHGAIIEGRRLSSGKPIYTNIDQAMAHGYEPKDYMEASSFNYDRMEDMTRQMDKLRELGKEPPHEMKSIFNFHKKQFKQNHKMASTVADRQKETEEKLNSKKKLPIKKSIVGMGYGDQASEINTGTFANESEAAKNSSVADRIHKEMEGYNYGDTPRSIHIDKGILYLTKVDDGMYSGYVKLQQLMANPDSGESQMMEDNAKVRIERMTIPTLCQFLLAKEYTLPAPSIAGSSPGNNSTLLQSEPATLESLNESLTLEPLSEAMPETPKVESSNIDKKIVMLELISKLIS